ncbi:hypothetical protein ACIBG8_43445 [Nonomuraea sp. NPDC050556]|uniref:hypothetical protein n=1 Tax=Nonomuraea sp. NPDC050556 TaxID=3364369 RepID=UPI0037A06A04
MGIFFDYYRAPDRQAATADPENSPAFDRVETKGIDPEVCLGQLIAFIEGVSDDLSPMETVTLYPPPMTIEEWEALPDGHPHKDGPGIAELPAGARDTLADVADDRLAGLAAQWARIDEFFAPPDEGYLVELITDLRGLAQRARAEDQLIYCWICM